MTDEQFESEPFVVPADPDAMIDAVTPLLMATSSALRYLRDATLRINCGSVPLAAMTAEKILLAITNHLGLHRDYTPEQMQAQVDQGGRILRELWGDKVVAVGEDVISFMAKDAVAEAERILGAQ